MQVDAKQLMPPPAPRPPKRKAVLEESAYTDAIEAIIERDFFPDVPKLQNQLDWLQAIQSGDPAKIRLAQQMIARRRAGLDPNAPAGGSNPAAAASALPSVGRLCTPAMTPMGATPMGATPAASEVGLQQPVPTTGASAAAAAAEAPRAPAMSLDAFCSQFTSEDNASFAQLQEQTIARKRLRAAHHLADKNQPLLLTGPGASSTDEYGTSGQTPGTLVDVKHVPKNRLYYNTSQQPALELSEKEVLALVQGAPKAIAHAATRLPGDAASTEDDPAAAVQQLAKDAAAAEGSTAAAAAAAAAGAAAAAHGTHGYGYMRTPNLAPGVDATPLMTWGTIASTPLRLEVDADLQGWQAAMTPSVPVDATPGPQFKMPEQRDREVKALAYINKRTATAAAARRASSGTPLLDALRRRMGSSSRGTPGHGGSSSGGGRAAAATPLSAAGRALATRLRGSGRTPAGAGGTGADTGALGPQLRASYNGTPTATAAAAAAASRKPVQGGSGGRAAGRAAAAPPAGGQQPVDSAGGVAAQGCITDGLLRLP